MKNLNMLRLCFSAAAAVLLACFDDAKLASAAAHGGASNEQDDLAMQADPTGTRMLLQAHQDEIVGTGSFDLTGWVKNLNKNCRDDQDVIGS